ncbi:uncharacterized protein LOC133497554 isoform X4 [Syngnathoides biaculeatus]|uniref:uncharacterized protein LOC133497554 isoform X4 n=1 Tax=Syngnathoides biaculeatus TaxID=300417 RepID=UPI002ADDE8F4|nr:uncharacterized protein LOC133497554 isoform X4 [Syngnathoides biaculeatus]
MCARKTTKYVDNLCGTNEDEPRRHLLGDVFKQPRADISEEYVCPEQQEAEIPHTEDGKEPEPPADIKEEEEEEEADVSKLPLTVVVVKNEDDDHQCQRTQLRPNPSEERRGAAPPSSSSSSSSQHVTIKREGEHRGGARADSLMAPLSNSDDVTTHSSDTDEEPRKGIFFTGWRSEKLTVFHDDLSIMSGDFTRFADCWNNKSLGAGISLNRAKTSGSRNNFRQLVNVAWSRPFVLFCFFNVRNASHMHPCQYVWYVPEVRSKFSQSANVRVELLFFFIPPHLGFPTEACLLKSCQKVHWKHRAGRFWQTRM